MPFEISSTYVWLAMAVVLTIMEISTTTLRCIWFVMGSLFAFAASFITDSIMAQLVVFIAVTGVCLAVTRPLAKKHLVPKTVPTNADMLIGKTCVVTEDILPGAKGRVAADGLSWLAQSDAPLKKGDQAQILAITGVTLTVSPITVTNS